MKLTQELAHASGLDGLDLQPCQTHFQPAEQDRQTAPQGSRMADGRWPMAAVQSALPLHSASIDPALGTRAEQERVLKPFL